MSGSFRSFSPVADTMSDTSRAAITIIFFPVRRDLGAASIFRSSACPGGRSELTSGLFLILGCLLESASAIIISVPILAPIAEALGIHPVHFGVVIVLNLLIGLLTPPVGLCL